MERRGKDTIIEHEENATVNALHMENFRQARKSIKELNEKQLIRPKEF